jgi:uroporphyrin-III C-methyltransferase
MTENEQSPMLTSTAPKKTVKKQYFCWLFSGLNVIGISVALAFAAYCYYIQSQQQQVLNQALDNTTTIYNTMQTILKRKPASSEQVQADIAAVQAKLVAQQAQLTQLSAQANKPKETPAAWLEVENLVHIADLNLRYLHNRQASLSLLNRASQHLEGAQKATLQGVIETLKVMPNTQVTAEKLQALSPQIDALELTQAQSQESPTAEQVETTSAQNAWSRSMEKLAKLIVIRKHTATPQLLLSEEQRIIVKQNCHLLQQQVQLALIQRDAALYTQSLDALQRLLATYAGQQAKQLLTDIEALKQIDVNPALPDLQALLATLKSPHLPSVAADGTK